MYCRSSFNSSKNITKAKKDHSQQFTLLISNITLFNSKLLLKATKIKLYKDLIIRPIVYIKQK